VLNESWPALIQGVAACGGWNKLLYSFTAWVGTGLLNVHPMLSV
jgi:hypothetical protein